MVQPEDDFHTKGAGIFTVHVHSKKQSSQQMCLGNLANTFSVCSTLARYTALQQE